MILATLGLITGNITLNPIVAGCLTGIAIILKTYREATNINNKTNLLNFSVMTCEKALSTLRNALRGETFDYKTFIHDMKIVHQEILE